MPEPQGLSLTPRYQGELAGLSAHSDYDPLTIARYAAARRLYTTAKDNTVFTLTDKLAIDRKERSIDRSELYRADEIFVCGSSVNITPVIAVDHRIVGLGKPGQLTKQLINLYRSYGRHDDGFDSPWAVAVN